MNTLSVSELNEQIKNLLETTFVRTFVEGELSRITYHNSGHIYFTLKDSSSSIKAVMFRGNASKLRFRLEEGLKVLVEGAITLYKPRGEYQINCFMIEPSGAGALALAYEQLKRRLQSEGMFDESRKKTLPKFVKKVALITSETGAALQDMLRVANKRWPLVEFTLFDVLVQGKQAPPSIRVAIEYADTQGFDVLVVSRGGGSIEDLWAFNEEEVARAIFKANTPVISAVGHEIDWLISDFVADVRAATPSAAMEMLLPDKNEMLMTLTSYEEQLTQALERKITNLQVNINHLQESYKRNSVEAKLTSKKEEIQNLQFTFNQRVEFLMQNFSKKIVPLEGNIESYSAMILAQKARTFKNMQEQLESNNPKKRTKKGFVEVVSHKKRVALSELSEGESITMVDIDYRVQAKVEKKEKI